MKRLIVILPVLAVLSIGGVAYATQDKVIICHHDQGNNGKDNVTIEVAQAAVAAHVAHGDSLGACAPTETPVPTPVPTPTPTPAATPLTLTPTAPKTVVEDTPVTNMGK